MIEPTPSSAAVSGARPLGVSVVRPRPGAVALVVDGEVDSLTASTVQDALDDVLGDRTADRLVVDLTGVTFLDSRGLAVLIRAADLASLRGLRLQLVIPSHAVRRPLEVTGVDRLFDVHDDLDAALEDRAPGDPG